MDLNYDIRKKEIELLELKNKLILSKEIEIKLASMNIELNEERKTSEILKNKLDILSNDYYKLMNDTKSEKKEKFNHLEKKTSLTFKNVNEEIKTLKTKIDGNIAKHIIKETSIKSNNNLDLTSHEKIKNLNQTNSNLTSFILILQNRLKLYVCLFNKYKDLFYFLNLIIGERHSSK